MPVSASAEKGGNVEAKHRGARRSVILGSAVVGLTILLAVPLVLAAQDGVSPEVRAQFTARYRAALGDLWHGKPLQAIDPLYQLVMEGGCEVHRCQMRLAQAYRYLGELEEAHRWAVSAVERAETKGSSGAEEYNELGVCLFEKASEGREDLDRSVEALREAVARHRGQGDTYLYNLSQALLAVGAADEAGGILDEFQGSQGLRPIIEKGEAVIGDYERLQVVQRKYAKYTLEAKRQGTEGQIFLRAIIDANGRVTDTEVINGLPNGLTEEALKALRKSKFQPAQLNGEPVAAIFHQSVDMKLTAALVSQHPITGDSHNH